MEVLQAGDWVGQGATAFFREMTSDVLPAFNRLLTSLEQAGQNTKKMSDIMKQAEEEAARFFRLDGGIGAAAVGGAVASEPIGGNGVGAAAVGEKAGGAAAPVAGEGTITFGDDAKQDVVSDHSRKVLQDIMKAAKLDNLTITSTERTPHSQAVAMFDNIQSDGVAGQKDLYGSLGDKVIDVYVAQQAAGKSKDEIISAMAAKINELGPGNLSHHLGDQSVLNVIDIAPSSIPDKAAFEKAVEAETRVLKFIKPPKDPSYHLEIPQPTK
jgi:hypothetical protein